MTNFLVELVEEDVPTYLKPLAVLIVLIIFVPACFLSFMIHVVNWIAELSPNQQDLALRLSVNTVVIIALLCFYFAELKTIGLETLIIYLCALALSVFVLLRDWTDWRRAL